MLGKSKSFIICPSMVIMRNQKVLLLRRARWAPVWPGHWHCPIGKMEEEELPLQTAIRETYEEVGLHTAASLGTVVAVKAKNFKNLNLTYKDISLFFVVEDFEGDPINKEPRLHDAMYWFDASDLPDPIIPVVKFGIEQYLRGEIYGEFVDGQRESSREVLLALSAEFRNLSQDDIPSIVSTFAELGWNKPASLYEKYLKEQEQHQRCVWLAFKNETFAGYVTLKWHSEYAPFHEENIPEISDLNVLPKFRKQGIGSALLDRAETEARKESLTVGIGVGLSADYGDAQRLYVKRGYLPDSRGITYNYHSVSFDSKVRLDDDLVLWFTKKLS